MLFFLPDFSEALLPEAEAQHCLKVLRLGQGAEISVTDGKGLMGKARIVDANPKKCKLTVFDSSLKPKDWEGSVWLGVAPTKNLDRMEWLVEKGTEIGCDGFLFIRTARTERDQINLERLGKVALSAMKQSGQAWMPELSWAGKWSSIPWANFDRLITADLGSENKTLNRKPNESCLILIGPEGDFTPQELEDLKQRKAESIKLRPQVLRTETAALYALSLAHF